MIKKVLFIVVGIATVFLSPALALFSGILLAFTIKPQFLKETKWLSKYLLQISVVGLGFGMNLQKSLQASSDGMIFTIVSVITVMSIGVILGRVFHIDKRLSYLISTGTAICGGSAIAAVSPVIKANDNQISVSLAVIFTLNAIAMFVFPPIGHWMDLSQTQFGTWAAIAIHDTSSVVGAGQMYGQKALEVATTVKLTRALWIIPLSVFSTFVFRDSDRKSISIPWFILLFILAMIFNTYVHIIPTISMIISQFAHRALSVTLFFIGSMLSFKALKDVGYKPIVLGVCIWMIIASMAMVVVCNLI